MSDILYIYILIKYMNIFWLKKRIVGKTSNYTFRKCYTSIDDIV